MRELFSSIESHEFSAHVNVASDLKTFLQAATQQKPTKDLLELLDDPVNHLNLFNQIMDLVRVRTDPRYQHPWDTPLAIYVWALSLKNLELANLAAESVNQLSQTWWAARISRNLLLDRQSRSMAGSVQYDYEVIFRKTLHNLKNIRSGETILFTHMINDTHTIHHVYERLEINRNLDHEDDKPKQWILQRQLPMSAFSPAAIESERSENSTDMEIVLYHD